MTQFALVLFRKVSGEGRVVNAVRGRDMLRWALACLTGSVLAMFSPDFMPTVVGAPVAVALVKLPTVIERLTDRAQESALEALRRSFDEAAAPGGAPRGRCG